MSNDRGRSHSRTPSINSSDFTVNPSYYDVNVSDSSLMNSTSSSDNENDSQAGDQHQVPARFDAVQYLLNSLNSSLNSLELDRSIVMQSQLSGLLNDKTQELTQRIEDLQKFLKESRTKVLEYEKTTIPGLMKDLNKSEKKLIELTNKMKKTHPIEYEKSKSKILNRISDEDDDLYV